METQKDAPSGDDMEVGPETDAQAAIPSIEIGDEDGGVDLSDKPILNTQAHLHRHKRETSVDMFSHEGEKSVLKASHSGASSTDPTLAGPVAAADLPPIDDQVSQVMGIVNTTTLREGQKGYLVSQKWLGRVLSRSAKVKSEKEAEPGDIGPVDSSDLELVGDVKFEDEVGEDFVAMRPGLLISDDFEILPQAAWDLIIKWYGLAAGSPVITRYCHDTTSSDVVENIQYEIYPPVFTLTKLPDLSSGVTLKSLKEKTHRPVKILASRHDKYVDFLRHAKVAANVDMSVKVRVWRILGSLSSSPTKTTIATPLQSRAASPAPGVVASGDPGDKLVLEVDTLAALQMGSERELLDAKDETTNEKYNGRSSLDLVGLRQDSVLVLEEMIGGPAGGDWVSDARAMKLRANGIPVNMNKSGLPMSRESSKLHASTGSRASSPGPAGMLTRGRQAKNGRTKGTVGLNNLGNTCYMNSALQCVRSVQELSTYFVEDNFQSELNFDNPLGHHGQVAKAYANLLKEMYSPTSNPSFAPKNFKNIIGRYGPSFSGYQQQDSQEFIMFLLDGLQEDLNRIHKKPYIEKPDSTDEMVEDQGALAAFADTCWDIYKKRNDSVITDLFAGMYKSTVVCPVCDKVSIIFDPFNNLTLQLPIENLWSRSIICFPLHGDLIWVNVDIDKNATIQNLKEFIAGKLPGNKDPKRLVLAEIYKNRFFRYFEDHKTISEETIADGDQLAMYELADLPNNPPNPQEARKPRPSLYAGSDDGPEDDSSLADCMLIPVFHRHPSSGGTRSSPGKAIFGTPGIITVTSEDAHDYEAILRRVLASTMTMTTRDFLTESEGSDSLNGDSDAVIMNSDDADTDSKVHAESLESEDGMIDISMRDNVDQDDSNRTERDTNSVHLPKILRKPGRIPQEVRDLFEMKYVSAGSEPVAAGWNSLHDDSKNLPTLASRSPRQAKGPEKKKASALEQISQRASRESPISSDEDADDIPQIVQPPIPQDDSDSDGLPEQSELMRPRFNKKMVTYSKKGKSPVPRIWQADGPSSPPDDSGTGGPFIHPGEIIVLDWTTEAMDALFNDRNRLGGNDMRGALTSDLTQVPTLPDPKLGQQRRTRNDRRKNGVSLGDCLDEFGKKEILSENDAWYCPRCKEHRRASKQFELWKAPDILVIHLKRFSAQGRFRDKLDVKVDFPLEGLDLSSRVRAQEPDKSPLYDLIAVDNHYGGLGGGHYTAFAQNFLDKAWYEYNDSIVGRRNNPEVSVVTPAAYLLFYRRRSSTHLGGPSFDRIMANPSPSNSPSGSRDSSPAGEGQRLDEVSSRSNGLSSALQGVGAAHQAAAGGAAGQSAGARMGMGMDDDLPAYSETDPRQTLEELEGMEVDRDEGIADMEHGPYNYNFNASLPSQEPGWSFATAANHRNSPEPGADPEENLLEDDNRSDRAGVSDVSEDRMADFEDDPGTTNGGFATPLTEAQRPPPLVADDLDQPAVEIRLEDEHEDELA